MVEGWRSRGDVFRCFLFLEVYDLFGSSDESCYVLLRLQLTNEVLWEPTIRVSLSALLGKLRCHPSPPVKAQKGVGSEERTSGRFQPCFFLLCSCDSQADPGKAMCQAVVVAFEESSLLNTQAMIMDGVKDFYERGTWGSKESIQPLMINVYVSSCSESILPWYGERPSDAIR